MFRFDWDEANLQHIALHSVSPEEAEQVLLGSPFELGTYEIDGEDRLEEVGCTSKGRILKVVTIIRSGRIRVATAYDASKAEKIAFLEHQRRLYE
jgi:uncharacterized DUF497 family protein